jgi:hypothetical protein
MLSAELAEAAAAFRRTLPFPEPTEAQGALEQCVLHDLIRVLRACSSEEHPPSPAQKRACMFFFGAIASGPAYIEQMKTYDDFPPDKRSLVDSSFEQVLEAMSSGQQPLYLYMSALRQADQASGARTFDSAVVAFDDFARVLLGLDPTRSEDDRDAGVRQIHYDLYAQPDDMSWVEAALADGLGPGWVKMGAWSQGDFQLIQYAHANGMQLDVNVGRHHWTVAGGRSAGPYSGAHWREEMARDLLAEARRVSPEAKPEREDSTKRPGDPVVLVKDVQRADHRVPPYLRVDVSGNPPEGGLSAMVDGSELGEHLRRRPGAVLLNLSGLWSFSIPPDVEWLRNVLLPMLASAGVRRVALVAGSNIYQWALRPWEGPLADGNPSVRCLPSSWYADEFFASGRRWEDAEVEWIDQAEEWLGQT